MPFLEASNFAHAVRGLHFDVVESPDYEQVGLFLRPAMREHDVVFGSVALALHGVISTSIRLNWRTEGDASLSLVERERLQYRSADLRYGISRAYLDEWAAATGIAGEYLDPLSTFSRSLPVSARPESGGPRLRFVGRGEKRKGPDVFIELVSWLPRSLYEAAEIIGPESFDPDGVGSNAHLEAFASARAPHVRLRPAATPEQLSQLFGERTLTILPSRYDTLNLIALESIFAGCPTAIGTGAGVVGLLREALPEVPFIPIDMKNPFSAVPELVDVLENYDAVREVLVESLGRWRPPVGAPRLAELYARRPGSDPIVAETLDHWYGRLIRARKTALSLREHRGEQAVRANPAKALAKKLLPHPVRAGLRRHASRGARLLDPAFYAERFAGAAARRETRRRVGAEVRSEEVLAHRRLAELEQALYRAPESTPAEVQAKLQELWRASETYRIDRARVWSEIARLERLRGNDLMAATYELRVMRSQGQDVRGDLRRCAATLRAYGLAREALVAEAMYGRSEDAEEGRARCLDLLEANRRNLIDNPAPRGLELLDDARPADFEPRVSVIVSLYGADRKLPRFLDALSRQSLFLRAEAELVLVDSSSPGREREVVRERASRLACPVVFARSKERETIQMAWNRGIALSRGEYLSFLGVDEMVVPEGLEKLAAALDRHRAVDWVQADSLVTEVDEDGLFVRDVMKYDREGYFQGLPYLETCYLSWVGAMYRRRIHERFGYYDPSFRAAGDTEFKGRVLPFIQTMALAEDLGLFWNYPDGQTTQSPWAELEDLRAWYLHRTAAGVDYAMKNAGARVAERRLRACLGYRKSYCGHVSTDIEYAAVLADYLDRQHPESALADSAPTLAATAGLYRALDWVDEPSPEAMAAALPAARAGLSKLRAELRARGGRAALDHFEVFNDNRYEQHHAPWKSELIASLD